MGREIYGFQNYVLTNGQSLSSLLKKLGGNAIKAKIILQETCVLCVEMLGGIMVSEIVAPHAFG